ncbi:MAG: LamG domain-containing protein, partial [Pseudomonadota bacterium]
MTTNNMTLTGRMKTLVSSAALALVLTACSSGSGPDVEGNPNTGGGPATSNYNGPAPATADVQAFKLNVWDNISLSSRCGGCHVDGQQSPQFARSDDINLAYESANTIVDLGSPQDSRMVTKVAGGHNCWLSSDQACADIMTTWIAGWAGDAAGAGGREISLNAPPIQDPGQSKNFPADSAAFQATVYPVLQQYCAGCHSSGSAIQQSPFFAEPPDTDTGRVDVAYEAAKQRIDLDEPANSRFVLRLGEEFHNCWDDCTANAAEMQTAIEAFANPIAPTQVDPALVFSKALTIFDGTIASGGNRHETSQIALWEFKSGSGSTAFDTSGVDPAVDLTLSGDVEWVGGWGINVRNGKAQGSTANSAKLHDLIKATGEYSIEAWVAPANVVQEEAHIIGYSAGTMARNFTLRQTLYDYDFFNRSDVTDGNGDPAVSTPSAEEVLQATLQHVVATYDPVEGRRIYVNGELRSQADPAGGGSIGDWDDTFAFVLGNEVSSDRLWQGVIRLVAIHNRAMTQEQIVQNFDVGVGEKFFLLFSVGHLISVPDSYVVFEVSQFDSYAYLFNEPFFVTLDNTAQIGSIPLQGMRIGINGAEAGAGQSWSTLDTTLTDAAYDPATGQPLSNIGGVIGLEKGPDSDEFFLTFDRLGDNTFVRTIDPPVAIDPSDLPEVADLGVRTFDEINATLAAVTGVDPQTPAVRDTYANLRQSLPAVDTLNAFLSSHQVAIDRRHTSELQSPL